jgi:hypothetical protein
VPLIRPEIQKVLREAGISQDRDTSEPQTLTEKLDAAGLSLDNVLGQLSTVAETTGNEALRVRCLETALKAHGALKETAPAIPSFTIVINDSSPSPQPSVNPILLPRQLLNNPSYIQSTTTIEKEKTN